MLLLAACGGPGTEDHAQGRADATAAPDATASCIDDDHDGYGAGCTAGPDCDDASAAVHPGAPDPAWDAIDADCDGHLGPRLTQVRSLTAGDSLGAFSEDGRVVVVTRERLYVEPLATLGVGAPLAVPLEPDRPVRALAWRRGTRLALAAEGGGFDVYDYPVLDSAPGYVGHVDGEKLLLDESTDQLLAVDHTTSEAPRVSIRSWFAPATPLEELTLAGTCDVVGAHRGLLYAGCQDPATSRVRLEWWATAATPERRGELLLGERGAPIWTSALGEERLWFYWRDYDLAQSTELAEVLEVFRFDDEGAPVPVRREEETVPPLLMAPSGDHFVGLFWDSFDRIGDDAGAWTSVARAPELEDAFGFALDADAQGVATVSTYGLVLVADLSGDVGTYRPGQRHLTGLGALALHGDQLVTHNARALQVLDLSRPSPTDEASRVPSFDSDVPPPVVGRGDVVFVSGKRDTDVYAFQGAPARLGWVAKLRFGAANQLVPVRRGGKDLMLVVNGPGGPDGFITTYDITNPRAPSLDLSTWRLDGQHVAAIADDGAHLYARLRCTTPVASGCVDEIMVFDVDASGALHEGAHFAVAFEGEPDGLAVVDGQLMLGGACGVRVLDAATGAAGACIAGPATAHWARPWFDTVVSGGLRGEPLVVLDRATRTWQPLPLVSPRSAEAPPQLAFDGARVAVAWGGADLAWATVE